MRICIYGAGAIGIVIGARLAATGRHDVCSVARGATCAALNARGLRLNTAEGLVQGPVRASETPAALGVQDLVIITVKAPALADVAQRIAPLLGPHTLVMPAMNGVPGGSARALKARPRDSPCAASTRTAPSPPAFPSNL